MAVAQRASAEGILDALLPVTGTMSEAALTQLRWNALAREEAITEFGAFTAAQLAELRGSATTNPHVSTGRWLARGEVFAIETPQGRLFPGFQFHDGRPRPVMARVLRALDGSLHGWEILGWCIGSNGYLDGQRPVDLLESDPDTVVFAAEQSALFARED